MSPTLPKKRKREQDQSAKPGIDTSKPSAIFEPTAGRKYTLSVALPGSIIANAKSHDLKTTLAGQIARALAVFCVDEIVIFDDGQVSKPAQHPYQPNGSKDSDAYSGNSDPNHFLMHLLAYLETPPHLRKLLFPLHPDLRTAGTLPSLDMPHHLRAHEWCQYREGVTIETPSDPNTPIAISTPNSKYTATTTYVDAGFVHPVAIPASIPPNTRVTLQFTSPTPPPSFLSTPLTGIPVAPSTPRTKSGYYWGYSLRSAPSLSAVFTESPFDGGYDLTVGTSERGKPLSSLKDPATGEPNTPVFNHMLLVFGGVAGLEAAARADEELAGLGVEDPGTLFEYWVNVCPGQGSRTIRTEEALWLGLMGLRDVVLMRGAKV